MSLIWVTADHHFGHANIIKHCARPFGTAQEMDAHLVSVWNSMVGAADLVYHLGDFAYRGQPQERYLRRLCGTVHLVRGNHDKRPEGAGFASVQDVLRLVVNGRQFWLSHYPHLSWPGSGRGSIHLHGHCHGKIPDAGRRFDVGVDVWGFAPVPLERFVKLAEEAK